MIKVCYFIPFFGLILCLSSQVFSNQKMCSEALNKEAILKAQNENNPLVLGDTLTGEDTNILAEAEEELLKSQPNAKKASQLSAAIRAFIKNPEFLWQWLTFAFVTNNSEKALNIIKNKIKSNDKLPAVIGEMTQKMNTLDKQVLPFENDPDSLYCEKDFGICAGYAQTSRLFSLLIHDSDSSAIFPSIVEEKELLRETENIKESLLTLNHYELVNFKTKVDYLAAVAKNEKAKNGLIDVALVHWLRNFISVKGLKQLADYNLHGLLNVLMQKRSLENLIRNLKEITKVYPPLMYVILGDMNKHGKDIHVVLTLDVVAATQAEPQYLKLRDDKLYGNKQIKNYENRIYVTKDKKMYYIAPHVFLDKVVIQKIIDVMNKNDKKEKKSASKKILEKLKEIILDNQKYPSKTYLGVKDMREFVKKELGLESIPADFDINILREFIDEVDFISMVPGEHKSIIKILDYNFQ